ncbi:hypothetical protein [Desulfobacter postgatei]|uniref:Uncharacterized protein n=1 Tax=Desulfobacter postgatei 2ac9 TaxID=879212 RepID=I5AY16_9BACT|nr:hypothetical protein [Desulfobacter postgatei]EIM62129.1 hypothetical protein DespoDRAFT_00081 [Desulfobacter postgatei 2ac9]
MKNLVTRSQFFTASIFSAFFGLFGMSFATPSVADLWTAFDISTINSQVLTILTTFVTINLAFLAYRYIRRTMGKG